MRRYKFLVLSGFLFLSHGTFAVDLSTTKQQYSYTMGIQVGQMLRAQDSGALDIDAFSAAIADYLGDKPIQLSQEKMRAALKYHYENMQSERNKLAKENLTRGAEFREENAKRHGVTTLENGLQYEVLEPGDGASPQKEDRVEVHYKGALIDGSVFDSSHTREKPAQFNLNRVVPGFREAITRMKPGAKWRVVMPPTLAYGEGGTGKKIGPNETLIFEIEYIGLVTTPLAK
ncbi:MAG: FKBP-type peptidyl-prolyl cis-trans isomerase [Candidatus Thiodiazotropha sp. (ex Epidulcina cf. delphinae)]|nr:FKBP-type peptidyl-prolyl cis-trans isomerase [Candidatus Thiodiazotropha sp. (ex Epidulcina cf. delphinae)]